MDYVESLKNQSEEGEMDIYSLKKELNNLAESSKIFDDFEKEAMHIDKETLKYIQDLSSLIKIKILASQIKNKKMINDGLHTLHFNLNLLKNPQIETANSINKLFDAFLYNPETKIDSLVNELNDFRAKLNEIKRHHLNLLPKSLDSKINIENKYNKHIEQLHSIHKRQKNALITATKLFLKITEKHIKCQKSKISDHTQKSVKCE